jgi:hypothetical protein
MRFSGALAFVTAVAVGLVPAAVGDAVEATISASAEVTTHTHAKVGTPVGDLGAKVKKYVPYDEFASSFDNTQTNITLISFLLSPQE